MLTERQTRSSYLAWCELFRLLRLKRQADRHHLSHRRMTYLYHNSGGYIDTSVWIRHLQLTLRQQKVDSYTKGPFNPRPLMSRARKAGEDALLWKLSRV